MLWASFKIPILKLTMPAKKSTRAISELQEIPGVGPSIAGDLHRIGITRVTQLKNANPQNLFERVNRDQGVTMDRCLLYVFRCAVYYASNNHHDPVKLKWWNWKD